MSNIQNEPDSLRSLVEAQLAGAPLAEGTPRSAEELLYELHVHQIELEMQNDELRRAQTALEESRDRYVDLYEFAPVGYLSLTREGMIAEVNLTGTTLLGVDRKKLLNHRFTSFVAPEDRDRWHRHFLNILQRDGHQSCELKLQHGNKSSFHVRMDCLHVKEGRVSLVRIALTDITLHKLAELQTRELSAHLQTVREEEKTRIAREIHDDLGSTLAALKMDAFWLARKLATDKKKEDPMLERAESMVGLLDTAAQALRRIITDLRPTILDDLGLLEALKWQAKQFHKRTGIECRVACPCNEQDNGKDKLGNALSIILFRISQEALANIARHSGATRVEVELRYANNEAVLSISDNGCGLPQEHTVAPTSYGIRGMRERVEQLGGKIGFDSAPGGGLRVTATIPLPSDPLAEALAKSETRYRSLFENMLDGYAYCKMRYDNRKRAVDFVYLNVNEAFGRQTGLNDVVGKPVSEVIPGLREQNPELFEVYGRVASTGIPEVCDFYLNALGKWFTISVFSPEKEHFIAVFCDITERKQAEAELRIAAIAFETHEGMMVTDQHANIIRVNHAFTDITGYSQEEVLGQNPRIMSSGRQDKAFFIEMWQQLLHTGSWTGEVWDKRKNGQVYPKWLTITAVKNEQYETSHYVAIFSDITTRKQTEEEIHKLAFYDSLTRLPNRRLLLDRFHAALAASARRDDYGAVLFIDLDRFKAINDTLGHDYGDLLLIEVGVRIKSCIREMDTVARFGGDEYVVLIEAISKDKDDATHKISLVSEKIRESLARPYKLKEQEHHSSPSIGISLYHGNGESLDELIEHADMAMYQAKEHGRNAVRFYDPVMQQNVAAHDALNNDLHYAIELQQLQLHYQIQVDNDNYPLGAEAFLRWIHPERGIIMPRQFIPIAEESDLIIGIGHWVLQTACHQLALWSKNENTRDFTLTVNISAKQFAKPEFVSEVTGILKEYQVDPTHLKLELSERLVMTDMSSTMDKINALKGMGVRLSMDNFGTVYSSLSYLKQLSSDQLKIHQEFVQGITLEGNDAELVQAVINLAKSLDLEIFAEGVETERQRAFLKNHDCHAYQGYLFGKPVPIVQFEYLLKQS